MKITKDEQNYVLQQLENQNYIPILSDYDVFIKLFYTIVKSKAPLNSREAYALRTDKTGAIEVLEYSESAYLDADDDDHLYYYASKWTVSMNVLFSILSCKLSQSILQNENLELIFVTERTSTGLYERMLSDSNMPLSLGTDDIQTIVTPLFISFFDLLKIKIYLNDLPNQTYNLYFEISPTDYIVSTDVSSTNSSLYSAYLDNKLTDFVLVSQTQTEFNVHSLILYTSGCEYFKGLFSSQFKHQNSIKLDFSDNTIKAFIDYIYLGQHTAKNFENIDMGEFYALANFVLNTELINLVLAYLDFNSHVSDLPELKYLYEMYPSEKLLDTIENLT